MPLGSAARELERSIPATVVIVLEHKPGRVANKASVRNLVKTVISGDSAPLDSHANLLVSQGFIVPHRPAYRYEHLGPTTGRAVDIAVRGERAYWIVANANRYGFTGVGVSQKGGSRFIHLDDLSAPDYPRPSVWSY